MQQGDPHAAEPPTARRIAPRFARARRGEIRGRLMFRKVRRHARAGHGDARGSPAAWLKGQARGWITAEYGMLPRATLERTRREASAGKQTGRTVEIQRLIGRSLRAVVDLKALGERQITIDCNVIQADGGTRTASITGAWIALYDCLAWMKAREMIEMGVLRDHIAAISCGVCGGVAVLDLDYAEEFASRH